ncbi:hypothetical protein GEMRC1_010132 [Eukaryota sp. GEM-RC1]
MPASDPDFNHIDEDVNSDSEVTSYASADNGQTSSGNDSEIPDYENSDDETSHPEAQDTTPINKLLKKVLLESSAVRPAVLRSLSERDITFFLEKYELYKNCENPLPITKLIPKRLLKVIQLEAESKSPKKIHTYLLSLTKISDPYEAKRLMRSCRMSAKINNPMHQLTDYYVRFLEITDRCNLSSKSKTVIRYFLRNLQPSFIAQQLEENVDLGYHRSLKDVYHEARKLQKSQRLRPRPQLSNQQRIQDTKTANDSKPRKQYRFKYPKSSGLSQQPPPPRSKHKDVFQISSNETKPLQCPVTINNKKLEAIIDTGSSISLLSENIQHSLNLTSTRLDNCLELRTISGRTNTQRVAKDIPIEIDLIDSKPSVVKQDLFIISEQNKIILGCDYLRKIGCLTDTSFHFQPNQKLDTDDDPVEELYPTVLQTDQASKSTNGITIQGFSEDQQEDLRGLLEEFSDVFDPKMPPEGIKCEPLALPLKFEKIISSSPRPLPPRKLKLANAIFDSLIEKGLARPSTSPYSSPVVLVEKSGKNPVSQETTQKSTKFWSLVFLTYLNSNFIACFDLPRAFHQIPVLERDIPKTAIAIPGRKIEYLRAPFGFANIPGHFQKQISNILDSHHTWIYIDDLTEFETTYENFRNNLVWILSTCREHNIRLSPQKSIITTNKFPIRIVGTIFCNGQRLPDPNKTSALTELPFPKTSTELRSFLGCVNFLRDFIPNLSESRAKLDELINQDRFEPSSEHEDCFNEIKAKVANIVPLTLPGPDSRLIVTTDASSKAIGATIFIETLPYQPNKPLSERSLKPVAFFSRKLTKCQQSWQTIKQELYAIVATLTYQPNRELLLGRHFELHTDHRNILFLLNNSENNPLFTRWKPILSEYEFSIHHIKGKDNQWADLLSRLSQEETNVLTCLTPADNEIFRNFDLQNLISDKESRFEFIDTIHRENGHLSKNRLLSRLKLWNLNPTLFKEDISTVLSNCGICQKFQELSFNNVSSTGKLFSNLPFQSVHVDMIGPLQQDALGNKYILAITDAFTRFSILCPTTDIRAETVADSIFTDVFCFFGLPESIRSDGGSEFDNTVLSAVLKRLNVKHMFSYPHHHESNGLAERRNKEIRSTLNKYTAELNERKNWSKLIPIIQLIINSIPCSSTGFSPFTLLFGTNTLPRRNVIEHIISQPASDVKLDNRTKATKYLLELETTLNELWNKANLTQASLVESRNPSTPLFKVGDLVLRKDLGKNKFLKHTGPFVVSRDSWLEWL